MSPSDSTVLTPLTIRTAELGTEVALLDHNYVTVDEGASEIHPSVGAGLYKIRVRTGGDVHDAYLRVDGAKVELVGAPPEATVAHDAGGRAVIDFGALAFESPVPFSASRRSSSRQLAWAAELSRATPITRGHGAEIFVFGRASADPDQADASAELALCDADGQILASLQEDGARRGSCVGMVVAVDPGFYRLRQRRRGGVIDQCLHAPPATAPTTAPWQLQVFFATPEPRADDEPVIDLGLIAMFLTRSKFVPDGRDLRLAELARESLVQRRAAVRPADLKDMLSEKFENPMLGIYALHLIAAAPEAGASWDRAEIAGVIDRLYALVGPYPDVMALDLGLTGRSPRAALTTPPMLAASWEMLVRASATQPGLIAADSRSTELALRRWSTGPWLAWWTAEPADADPLVAHEPDPRDEVAEYVLRYVGDADRRAPASYDATEDRVVTLDDLVERTSLPASLVHAATERLVVGSADSLSPRTRGRLERLRNRDRE